MPRTQVPSVACTHVCTLRTGGDPTLPIRPFWPERIR